MSETAPPNIWPETEPVPTVPGQPGYEAPAGEKVPSKAKFASWSHTGVPPNPQHTSSPLGLSKGAKNEDKERIAQEAHGSSYDELPAKEQERVSREAFEYKYGDDSAAKGAHNKDKD